MRSIRRKGGRERIIISKRECHGMVDSRKEGARMGIKCAIWMKELEGSEIMDEQA